MKIIQLFIICMLSMQSIMYASEQDITPAQLRQNIIDSAMAPENFIDLKQDLAFLESQNLVEPDSFLKLLEENVTQSQDATFDEVIEIAHDLITQHMKNPFISTLELALQENHPIDQYMNSVENPLFTYIMQRQDNDIALQNIVYSWLLKWNSQTTDKGTTALYVAAQNGHTQIVELLLAAGANVNSPRTDNGMTPLLIAAQNGHAQIMQLLLAAGANVDIQRTDSGTTPLFIAAQLGHTQIVRLLLAAGADITLRDNSGRTAEGVARTDEIRDLLTQDGEKREQEQRDARKMAVFENQIKKDWR